MLLTPVAHDAMPAGVLRVGSRRVTRTCRKASERVRQPQGMPQFVGGGSVPVVGMAGGCMDLIRSGQPYFRGCTEPWNTRVCRQISLCRFRRQRRRESVFAVSAFIEVSKVDIALTHRSLTLFGEAHIRHIRPLVHGLPR